MARITIPVLIAAIALLFVGLAILVLPACGVRSLILPNGCPPAADLAANDRQAALAARGAQLEAEIAALQRRVAALPACQPVAAAPRPEAPPAAPPSPAAGLDEDRWRKRDVRVLEGCWHLDSDYTMIDQATRKPIGVASWKMCFDAQGRGRETQVFKNGLKCEGPVNARFLPTGQLQIEEDANIPCSGGKQITRRRATCDLAPGGKANCSTIHPDRRGSQPHPVSLRR